MSASRIASYGIGLAVLAAGAISMALLFGLKRPPAEATEALAEPILYVRGIRVAPINAPVVVRAFGEVRPVRQVRIAPEVSGVVVQTHPRLEVGGIVRAGALLFQLDPRPYEAKVRETEALVGQWEAARKRLEVERENSRKRETTLARNQEIAKAAYTRAQEMEAQGIGNRTDRDVSEAAFNESADALDQLQQQLALYEVRIEEAAENVRAAEARLDMARLDLEKTAVRSPFDGRITERRLALGHAATAGEPALSLADDSILEIPVQINSADAQRWLRFESRTSEATGWFDGIAATPCSVRWTDSTGDLEWRGALDRVESFDPASHTLAVIVQVTAKEAATPAFPLAAGMFCEVAIPGRELDAVYAVPQWAVTVDREVYLALDGRLTARPVEVARTENGATYIRHGLDPGDVVITTRLINPIENTRVEVDFEPATSDAQG